MTLSPRSLTLILVALIPGVTAALLFSDIVNHDFLRWDDYPYIVNNANIQQLNLANLKWAFLEHYYHNWHPLTWLVYMIEYQLWGANAFPFKIVNLGLHILNSYLILMLTHKILDILYPPSPASTDDDNRLRWIACFLAGVFFAIHPLHVESVVWISELKDVLSGIFFFAALLAYIHYRQTDGDKRWRNLVGLFFLCALMSKTMAVTLPAALIVMDVFLFQRLTGTHWLSGMMTLVREKLIYIIVSVCVSAITLLSQTTESLESTGILTRLINAVESVPFYLGKFLVPVKLSPVYPFSSMSLDPGIHSLIPLALLVGCVIVIWSIEKYVVKGAIYALIFFAITILPVIGLVKVGEQAAADRYTYIPMSMFFIVAGCGLFRLLKAFSRQRVASGLSLGITLALLCAYAWQTRLYVPIWQTDEKLWLHVNRVYPMRVAVAYLNLGNVERRKGSNESALTHYESALVIDNDNVLALINRANVNADLGNQDLAIRLFRELAELHKYSLLAQNMSALAMQRLGRPKLAAELMHQALGLAPTSGFQLYESAAADYKVGKIARASDKISDLLRLNNNHRQGRILHVALLISRGMSKEADQQLEVLRKEFPDDQQIQQIYFQLKNQPAQ